MFGSTPRDYLLYINSSETRYCDTFGQLVRYERLVTNINLRQCPAISTFIQFIANKIKYVKKYVETINAAYRFHIHFDGVNNIDNKSINSVNLNVT